MVQSCAKNLHPEVDRAKLKHVKTKDLTDCLDSLVSRKPSIFYTKVTTDYKDTNRNLSFKTNIRMKIDSAMSFTITFMRIPVVNALINKDSITIVNKKDKCFIKNSLSYIKDNFGVDFEYKNLEELFLGLPLAYDTTHKYFQIHDPYRYTISSHRKWEMKKLDKKNADEVILKYFVNDSVTHLSGMEIESPADSTIINVNYLTREKVGDYWLPKDMLVDITSPRNHIRLELRYENMDVVTPEEIFIVIPDSYEACD